MAWETEPGADSRKRQHNGEPDPTAVEDSAEPPPTTVGDSVRRLISATCTLEDRILPVLDVDRLIEGLSERNG